MNAIVAKYDQGVIFLEILFFTVQRIHFFNDDIQANPNTTKC
jgi:hypothetical protein